MARVAIVTGGTRGIGEAISLALRDAGMTVTATYAGDVERAKTFTDRTGIAAYRWDVGDHQACLAGCALVESEVGPIDVVVNNAGITRDGTMPEDDARGLGRGDAGQPGRLFQHVRRRPSPACGTRKWGRIVNIGSINGQAGQYGQVNYAAAKSGIHGFTKALAQEGARVGVTVNAIAPGYVDTEMVARGAGRCAGEDRGADSGRPPGPGGGDRARRDVPVFGGGGVRDGLDAEHQWGGSICTDEPRRGHARAAATPAPSAEPRPDSAERVRWRDPSAGSGAAAAAPARVARACARTKRAGCLATTGPHPRYATRGLLPIRDRGEEEERGSATPARSVQPEARHRQYPGLPDRPTARPARAPPPAPRIVPSDRSPRPAIELPSNPPAIAPTIVPVVPLLQRRGT